MSIEYTKYERLFNAELAEHTEKSKNIG